jgi:hypothetical protein
LVYPSRWDTVTCNIVIFSLPVFLHFAELLKAPYDKKLLIGAAKMVA